MPRVRQHPGTEAEFEMHYLVDNFVEPWRKPQTILMLHGNAESSAVWYGWVPHLVQHYEVLRPDMRGFGASTAMPADYPWTLDTLVDDYVALMDTLGLQRVHLVAAKFAGMVARRLAARHPRRLHSLTLVGTPTAKRKWIDTAQMAKEVETAGVETWARRTMASRLGSSFDPAGVDWWIRHMGQTAPTSQIAYWRSGISLTDVTDDLPLISSPTLVIVTEDSWLGSVDETREWQEKISDSRLVVLPGNSYHVAASDADRCAIETLKFIRQVH